MAQTEMFGTFVEPTPNALTESMRRFSLKNRKSSYGSSSYGGSSATNESTSNSSRPSVAEQGRRKSGLSSFSSKLKKARSRTISELPTVRQERRSGHLTLGDQFHDLPAEIQTTVLEYLSTTDLLSLRLSSKQSLAVFQANAPTISRNALLPSTGGDDSEFSSSILIELYPSTFSSTVTDAYFLRSLRRHAGIKRQLHVLITFLQTRSYMLRLTRELECEHFGPYKKGLAARLYQPIALVQHFLETVRYLVLNLHPNHCSPRLTIDLCPSCVQHLQTTVSSYPESQLVPIYQTLQLLIQHFRTAVRSPSSVTVFERKLKGWSYGPPPEAHAAQFVLLGGIQELSKVNEMQGSYTKRLAIVKQYSDMVERAMRINDIAFPDIYQTQSDPVTAMAMGGGSSRKEKSKQMPLSASSTTRRDRVDVRTAIEGHADEQSIMKSLDLRLDLVNESVIASIPHLDKFLAGPQTLLGRRILQLKLVDHEKELLSPYGWVTRLLAQCYRPENVANDLPLTHRQPT